MVCIEFGFFRVISEVQFSYFTYISVFIFEIPDKVQHSQSSVSEYKLEFLSTIVLISKEISLKMDF